MWLTKLVWYSVRLRDAGGAEWTTVMLRHRTSMAQTLASTMS